MHVRRQFDQLLFGESAGRLFNPPEIARPETLLRSRMNIFQEQNVQRPLRFLRFSGLPSVVFVVLFAVFPSSPAPVKVYSWS